MIDKETIGQAFEAAASEIAPTYLAEAETDEYPFIVYNQSLSPDFSKDGIVAIHSQLEATVVDRDPDHAEEIAGLLAAAMRNNMANYSVRPDSLSRDCTDGIWEITLTWIIIQDKFD